MWKMQPLLWHNFSTNLDSLKSLLRVTGGGKGVLSEETV